MFEKLISRGKPSSQEVETHLFKLKLWYFVWCDHEETMVRFNKKESEARKELLASMNQVNDAKENENGKDNRGLLSYFN